MSFSSRQGKGVKKVKVRSGCIAPWLGEQDQSAYSIVACEGLAFDCLPGGSFVSCDTGHSVNTRGGGFEDLLQVQRLQKAGICFPQNQTLRLRLQVDFECGDFEA